MLITNDIYKSINSPLCERNDSAKNVENQLSLNYSGGQQK